jgi:hypothetical protein
VRNLRITSDSSVSTRYYSGTDAACIKIASELDAMLVQTSPYPDDGVKSWQSLDLLESANLTNDDIHVILIGGNDPYHANPWVPGWLANVEAMIDLAQAAGTPATLVCSQLPQKVQSITAALPDAHYQLKALCAAQGVKYVPLWEQFIWEAGQRLNVTTCSALFRPDPDTGHPNIAGNTIIANVVKAAFDQMMPVQPAGQCWNSLQYGTNQVVSNGRLAVAQPANELGGSVKATVGKSSGKWYFEVGVLVSAAVHSAMVGVTRGAYNCITSLGTTGTDDFWYDSTGRRNTNGSPAESTSLTTWGAVGNKVGVKVDLDGGSLSFIDKNGAAVTGFTLPAGTYYPIAGHLSGAKAGNKIIANFAGPFHHGLPAGYSAFV